MTPYLFFGLTFRQTAYLLAVLAVISLALDLAVIQPLGIVVSVATAVYAAVCAYFVIRYRQLKSR